jgi:hypothetical protein
MRRPAHLSQKEQGITSRLGGGPRDRIRATIVAGLDDLSTNVSCEESTAMIHGQEVRPRLTG